MPSLPPRPSLPSLHSLRPSARSAARVPKVPVPTARAIVDCAVYVDGSGWKANSPIPLPSRRSADAATDSSGSVCMPRTKAR